MKDVGRGRGSYMFWPLRIFINSNEISSRVHFFTELTPPKYPFSPAIPMSETIIPPSDVQDKGRLI